MTGKIKRFNTPANLKAWTVKFAGLIETYTMEVMEGILAYLQTDEFWLKKVIEKPEPLDYFIKELKDDKPSHIKDKYERAEAVKSVSDQRAAVRQNKEEMNNGKPNRKSGNYPQKLRGQKLTDHNRAVIEQVKREMYGQR